MGQKHNNRKRIRHRPMRARRGCELQPAPIQPGPLLCGSQPLPTMRLISWRYPPSLPGQCSSCCGGETMAARERRIFGGEEGEVEDGTDLKGQMLDVVLGLFNGMDYDDVR